MNKETIEEHLKLLGQFYEYQIEEFDKAIQKIDENFDSFQISTKESKVLKNLFIAIMIEVKWNILKSLKRQ